MAVALEWIDNMEWIWWCGCRITVIKTCAHDLSALRSLLGFFRWIVHHRCKIERQEGKQTVKNETKPKKKKHPIISNEMHSKTRSLVLVSLNRIREQLRALTSGCFSHFLCKRPTKLRWHWMQIKLVFGRWQMQSDSAPLNCFGIVKSIIFWQNLRNIFRNNLKFERFSNWMASIRLQMFVCYVSPRHVRPLM